MTGAPSANESKPTGWSVSYLPRPKRMTTVPRIDCSGCHAVLIPVVVPDYDKVRAAGFVLSAGCPHCHMLNTKWIDKGTDLYEKLKDFMSRPARKALADQRVARSRQRFEADRRFRNIPVTVKN